MFFYRLCDKHSKVWYSLEKSSLFQDHTEAAQMVSYRSNNGSQFLIVNSDFQAVSGIRYKISDNLSLVLSNQKEDQDEINKHALRLNFDYDVEFNPNQGGAGKASNYLFVFLLPGIAILILIGFGLVYAIRRVRKGGRFIHDHIDGRFVLTSEKEPDPAARSVSSRDFTVAPPMSNRNKQRATADRTQRRSRQSYNPKKRAATERESMKVDFSLPTGKKADSFTRISESQEYSLGTDSKLDDSRPSIDPTPMVEPNSIITNTEYIMPQLADRPSESERIDEGTLQEKFDTRED